MISEIKGNFVDEDDYWLGVLTNHKRIHHPQAILAFYTFISSDYGREGI